MYRLQTVSNAPINQGGTQGFQGLLGERGMQGLDGFLGERGLQGLYGHTGYQGLQGPCNETKQKDSSIIYKQSINSVVTILTRSASGSYYVGQGFWYERKGVNSGYLITAAHVITDPDIQGNITMKDIWIHTTYPTNTIYKVDGISNVVIGKDNINDVAVLKIQGNYFPVLYSVNSRTSVKTGEAVTIIGYPYGIDVQSVTRGIVRDNKAQLNIYSSNENVMESVVTDASIYEGNSGGPMLNDDGKWMGILSWGYDNSLNGGVASYLALPLINYFIDNYTGAIVSYPKGYIGVNITTVDVLTVVTNNLPSVAGYLVTGLDTSINPPNFNIGDIIISVNGNSVGIMNNEFCLFTEIQLPKAGTEVSIRYRPIGNYNTVLTKTIKLSSFPSDKDYMFSGYTRKPISKKLLKVNI